MPFLLSKLHIFITYFGNSVEAGLQLKKKSLLIFLFIRPDYTKL